MASRRGFACMSSEKQREIASKGGKTAHARVQLTNGPVKKLGRPGGKAAR